jgi:hypothetical protein
MVQRLLVVTEGFAADRPTEIINSIGNAGQLRGFGNSMHGK